MSELVCYCFRVEKSRIVAAIEDGCHTVEALSAKLRTCTGCGGCRPDLEDLIRFYGEENRPVVRPKAEADSAPPAPRPLSFPLQ
jgi:NAD(P)H-nitrite reductase large subunit